MDESLDSFLKRDGKIKKIKTPHYIPTNNSRCTKRELDAGKPVPFEERQRIKRKRK